MWKIFVVNTTGKKLNLVDISNWVSVHMYLRISNEFHILLVTPTNVNIRMRYFSDPVFFYSS